MPARFRAACDRFLQFHSSETLEKAYLVLAYGRYTRNHTAARLAFTGLVVNAVVLGWKWVLATSRCVPYLPPPPHTHTVAAVAAVLSDPA